MRKATKTIGILGQHETCYGNEGKGSATFRRGLANEGTGDKEGGGVGVNLF